jgi:site-specific DNA-methyltransferase (adenine-specific)
MELDKIITGDSAVVLQSFPPDCIDLTVTSPPYDNLRTYNGFVFDFETIAKQLFRTTKAGGVVVWVVNDGVLDGSETGTSFKQALYFMECGFNLHDTMIYEKDSLNMPQSNRYYQVMEYMFVFSKGSPKTANLLQEKTIHRGNNNTSTTRQADGTLKNHKYETGKATRNKGNVWRYGAGYMKSTTDKQAFEHPAMFPEALARDHILSWSNENDLVLDCFCGSGTTPKQAKMLNRHYLGIEISPEYVTLAEKRLLATPVPLFGQGRGLTLPAPDGGDSAHSQALSTPDMFSAIEHEPTPAPRR